MNHRRPLATTFEHMRDFGKGFPPEQSAIREKRDSGESFAEFTLEDVESSIPEQFEKIVQTYPDRLAVKMGDRALTYDELNQAANRLARAILEKRGPDNEPIALLFEHGIDGIVALLGVLKARKSYVLLDASSPTDRLRYILRDSGASLVVFNRHTSSLAYELQPTKDSTLNLENVSCLLSTADLRLPILSQDMAAIIYTSGSTGSPKGVVVSHGYHLNYAWVFSNEVQARPEDRLSLLHSLSFSSAIVNLVRALLNGAALFPFDFKTEGIDRLEKWLSAERITILHSPPALFRQLTDATGGRTFADLRIIELSGAPITTAEFDAYKRLSGGRTLLELQMGSTEAGTITSAVVDQQFRYPNQGFPVGYACPGRRISLLDETGHEVAQGEVGEIAVSGRHLASGYWKNPELTKARFLPVPDGGDERIFLTGDLGQRMPDGLIVHRGRKDFMVKIRGFRVEIAEIERALSSHPLVKDAAVVAWDRHPGEKYLVGYVVGQRRSVVTVSDLRIFLSERLPDYMVPSTFVFLELFPSTNGKLDRGGLPAPESSRPNLDAAYVGAGSELERQLVGLWEDVLDIRPIGVNDNFFDLGGHSLAGARIVGEIYRQYEMELPLQALFESPTIAQLSAIIKHGWKNKTRSGDKDWRYLFELQAGRARSPLFFFPGGGGTESEFFIYARLVRHLGSEYSVYGLRARGGDGFSQPHASVEEMAAAYLEEIRASQPEGPYYLIGECAGGVTAYEAARQLCARGDEVAFLALLDVERPTAAKYWTYRAWEMLRIALIRFHWEQLQQLEWSRWPAYLCGKGTGEPPTQRGVVPGAELLRARAQAVLETNRTGQAARHVERTRAHYRRVVRRYSPQSYTGPITIIACEKFYRDDPTLGWSGLTGNNLRTHAVPGDHDSYLREHVQVTAQQLRKFLEEGESRAVNRKHTQENLQAHA